MKNDSTIQKSLDKTLPRAFIDLKQIRQALISIIKNALEVMPDGGIFSIINLHFFEKACIVELNADVETGHSKFEIR